MDRLPDCLTACCVLLNERAISAGGEWALNHQPHLHPSSPKYSRLPSVVLEYSGGGWEMVYQIWKQYTTSSCLINCWNEFLLHEMADVFSTKSSPDNLSSSVSLERQTRHHHLEFVIMPAMWPMRQTVMWSPPSVHLSLCPKFCHQDNSKSTERICMKLIGKAGHRPVKKTLTLSPSTWRGQDSGLAQTGP